MKGAIRETGGIFFGWNFRDLDLAWCIEKLTAKVASGIFFKKNDCLSFQHPYSPRGPSLPPPRATAASKVMGLVGIAKNPL